MKLTGKIRILLYVLLATMMPLVVLLSSTLYFAFSDGFFLKSFEAEKTAQLLELDESGMKQVVENLTDYMAGRVVSMDIQVPINGEMTRFYNERELAHMVDVRNLMALGQNVRSALLLASLLIFIMLKRYGGMKTLWSGGLASALGALGFAGVLGILAVTDFSAAFYKFHELFFTNDLWLLDPATDRLIRMLPETFFFAITARILIYSGLGILLMGVSSWWGLRRYRMDEIEEKAHANPL